MPSKTAAEIYLPKNGQKIGRLKKKKKVCRMHQNQLKIPKSIALAGQPSSTIHPKFKNFGIELSEKVPGKKGHVSMCFVYFFDFLPFFFSFSSTKNVEFELRQNISKLKFSTICINCAFVELNWESVDFYKTYII